MTISRWVEGTHRIGTWQNGHALMCDFLLFRKSTKKAILLGTLENGMVLAIPSNLDIYYRWYNCKRHGSVCCIVSLYPTNLWPDLTLPWNPGLQASNPFLFFNQNRWALSAIAKKTNKIKAFWEWIFRLVTCLFILQGITKQSPKKRTTHLSHIPFLCHSHGGRRAIGGVFALGIPSSITLLLLVNGIQIRDIRADVARFLLLFSFWAF